MTAPQFAALLDVPLWQVERALGALQEKGLITMSTSDGSPSTPLDDAAEVAS